MPRSYPFYRNHITTDLTPNLVRLPEKIQRISTWITKLGFSKIGKGLGNIRLANYFLIISICCFLKTPTEIEKTWRHVFCVQGENNHFHLTHIKERSQC